MGNKHSVGVVKTGVGKKCSKCGRWLDVSKFTVNPRGVIRAKCDVCFKVYGGDTRGVPRKVGWDKNYRKEYDLQRHYGISYDEYTSLFILQEGQCPICKDVLGKGKKNHVDHDHKTGKVRGILCMHCNRGLGAFKDSMGVLGFAISYLAGK